MKKPQVPPSKNTNPSPSKSAIIKKRLIFVGIISIALFSLYSFGKQNDLLGNRTRTDGRQILLKESVVENDINNIPEVHRKINPPFQTSKRSPVSLYRWFLDDENNKNYNTLLEFIKTDGWQETESSTTDSSWSGEKITTDNRTLHLIIRRVKAKEEYAGESFNDSTISIVLFFN